LSEKKIYRKFTPRQKLELVMASWRGERSIAELCREHDISESLLRRWREQVLEAGAERFAAGEQRFAGRRAAQEDRRA
jgi:transposase